MRLHHIDYLRLLRVVQEGTHVAHGHRGDRGH